MPKKIILFMSELRKGATEEEYSCIDNFKVTGMQTNEAPVKYLMSKNPDISQIYCIVTNEALDNAWLRFESEINRDYPVVALQKIIYGKLMDNTDNIIGKILSQIHTGDELYLDTTGGLRNDNIYLLLISRILAYRSVFLRAAVYSNYQKKEIEDVTYFFHMFDLISGINEFTSFGSADTLHKYFIDNDKEKTIKHLVKTMLSLNEAITLCRTDKLKDKMKYFTNALDECEKKASDPMFRELLPLFREKYVDRMTIPGIIGWCAENGLIQQALTIFTELIPEWIMVDKKFITAPPYIQISEIKYYENRYTALLNNYFLQMSSQHNQTGNRRDSRVLTLENIETYLPESVFRINLPFDKIKEICLDYLYIKMLRNHINHAADRNTVPKDLLQYFENNGYKVDFEKLGIKDIRDVIYNSLEHLDMEINK